MFGFWMVAPAMAGVRMVARPVVLGSLAAAGVPVVAGTRRWVRRERRITSEPPPVLPGSASAASFVAAVVLTKREAFDVCEALAESERTLLRSGHAGPAARLAALFEMIESRLVADP